MDERYDLGIPHPITPYPKLIINAAITGMVPQKKDNPNIPVSIDEIIEDAVKCYKAGASIVHVHARDDEQKPTYKKEIYAKIIEGIRSQCADVIICATTSGRIDNTFEKRSQVLELNGKYKPDMGSLTLGSLNFPQKASVNSPDMIERLALKMKKNDIVPEIEVFESGMISAAKILIKKGALSGPFYFNLLFGSIYSIPATLFDISYIVKNLPPDVHWAAAGIGKFQLKVNFASVLMGGHVRVGLEDNLFYNHETGDLATNKMLIERVVKFADVIGRKVASAQEVRDLLGINPK
jgi:uncharacterized protein (DUF849 family)